MKRSLSLVLAVLMVFALVPAIVLNVAATESTASTYLVYQQDFSSVDSNAVNTTLMEQLGWYVPASKADTDKASYSVVEVKDEQGNVIDKALRVNTLNATAESFVNVFGGDVMPLLIDSDFTLEYRLTYSELTTNNNGYAALIYNYNGMHGSVANGEGNEVYGIAAVRMCGTGFNAVYYPVSGAECALHSLEKDGQTMASRYDNAADTYPSLYARLFPAAAQEPAFSSRVYKDSDVMKNRTLAIKIAYDCEEGITVYINGVTVSTTNMEVKNAGYTFNTGKLWEDFLTRNDGATVALLTQPGVVADIDDIVITTAGFNVDKELQKPNLMITEVSALPDDYWTKFVEIYNPTDKPIDVANYSLIKAADFTDGYATDSIVSTRDKKFTTYVKLGDFFGQEIRNRDAQFFNASELSAIPSWDYATQWYFTASEVAVINEIAEGMGLGSAVKASSQTYARDSKKPSSSNNYSYSASSSGSYYLWNLPEGITFSKNANGDFDPDPNGTYYLVNYVENWNTQYVRGNEDYATNTMLNPGDTMVLLMLSVGYLPAFTNGCINNGSLSHEYDIKGFRYMYQNYGLSKDTKILAMSGFTMSDLEMATLAIGKSEDELGNEIDYTKQYVNDLTNIETLVRYNPILATGRVAEADNMFESGTIGTGGYYRQNSSAVYVYGVDASSDYRIGTLYNTCNPVKSSIKDPLNSQWNKSYGTGTQHVGKLADYQEILFKYFFERTDSNPPLMITEILPVTENLAGEAKRAFTAIELTNTAGKAVNVYDYALTRTKSGIYNNKSEAGFFYSTVMRPGNPVDRGDGNGAYYYFAEENISNPETCVIQPGESVVIWFINADTYTSYYNDDEFGMDYFRQYWVNNGCPDLGMQLTNGEYAVKVIAVDGCNDETYNAPNAGRVFSPAYGTYDSKGKIFYHNTCAIYGVAKQTDDVVNGMVRQKDVVSVACFGLASAYYELNMTALEAVDGTLDPGTQLPETYYANVLKCSNAPVNTGMRYVVGATYSNRISAMKQTMKVNDAYLATSGSFYSTNPDATFRIRLTANNALRPAGLGSLEGIEAYGLAGTLVQSVQSGNQNVYRYFAQQKNVIATLSGAALSTAGGDAKLRFDSVIRLNTFATLAATYGENFTYGTLVIKSELLNEDTVLSKENLLALGAVPVETSLLYYTDEYAVLGAAYAVDAANYGTEYTAVAYMEIKTDSTKKADLYSSSVSAQGSVNAVAKRALRDLSATMDANYAYEVEGTDKFSRYTKEQRERLALLEG